MTQADPTQDRLLVGSCLDTLKTLADESIDSIVTDPPYELGFMGKQWDASGIAYQVELWAECLRVLKPGGHLLAFGGTRTYHRMAVAIEDAGFEIRDSIHWTYGSGFPKSLNIAKSIEAKIKTGSSNKTAFKKLNGEQVERGNWGIAKQQHTHGQRDTNYDETAGDTRLGKLVPTTPEAKKWDGWGTALKPSHEPIVVARKPLTGTVADTVLQHGTGGINIDATRIGRSIGDVSTGGYGNGGIGMSEVGEGGDAGKGAEWVESTTGRFPANTLLTHNHDCQETGTTTDQPVAGKRTATFGTQDTQSGGDGSGGWSSPPITTTTWSCTPNCPVDLLDQQSGTLTPGHWTKTKTTGFGEFGNGKSEYHGTGPKSDAGGASRFFHNSQWTTADDLTPFIYQAKPGKKERNAGLDHLEDKRQDEDDYERAGTTNPRNRSQLQRKNFHPTVKPVELIRYLIRMVTPPKGIVLDPFLGSGTTAVAAVLEGFEWKGCELTEDYLPIIKGRVKWATKQVKKEVKQETLL